MKKIFSIMILCVLLINLSSASVSWTIPTDVDTNSNFNIDILGNQFYGLELYIPDGFIIVSDNSNGVLKDNIYRTTYASNLSIVIRTPPEANSYIFYGNYAEGSGVISLRDKELNVYNSGESSVTCPECPSVSGWSECVSGKKIRNIYECSSETDYICKIKIEESSCIETNEEIEETEDKPNIFVRFINWIKSFFK